MHALKTVTAQQRPLKNFAIHSTSTCASQASTYGKCVAANYADAKKDMCKEEFTLFGECLRKAVCLP